MLLMLIADGTINLESIEREIRDSSDFHCTKTQMIAIENTQNYCGGRVIRPEYMSQV
jgi:threonine aldolase